MAEAWHVSLHGGHSGEYSLHGRDTLPAMLDAAVAAGFSTFGVTAHSPRSDERFLYPEEVERGYSPDELMADFARYAEESRGLVEEYAGRLEVLRGAEIEVVPEDGYAVEVADLRERFGLDYVVGSVHWVDEVPLDTEEADFWRAVEGRGGLEAFLVRYFELTAEMVESVRPEVVGHLDKARMFCEGAAEWGSGEVRRGVDAVLERMAAVGCIADLNTRSLRRGGAVPYPAPWIVERAREIGVAFCFGDDSHSVEDVGMGLDAGREYLLGLGVESITKLTRRDGEVVREVVPLS